MKTVRELLGAKGSDIWSVSPDTSVFEALNIMAEKNIGALMVFDGTELVGVFSERDYARKVILVGKTSKETVVSEIMTEDVVWVRPDNNVVDCMALMTQKHIRHLPVCEGGSPIGVISIGDVVGAIIGDKEFIIEQLENYIAGGR